MPDNMPDNIPDLGNLLLVRWLDAHNYPINWTLIEEVEPYLCEVRSVGWEIYRDDKQLVMSADVAEDIDGETQINAFFAIPVGCIVSEEILRHNNG
jgi:hypothetical protein